MKCEGSSCYGTLHFIHAQSVSVCLVPDTLALLPLSVRCISANTIALCVAVCLGHHLRTAHRNILT